MQTTQLKRIYNQHPKVLIMKQQESIDSRVWIDKTHTQVQLRILLAYDTENKERNRNNRDDSNYALIY